jgi:hypothetical protein
MASPRWKSTGPDRAARRRHGKTDTVDALAAAHAVLSGRANGTAKTGDGPVEMLRMFRLARTSAVKARTQAINQLKAVIVGADTESIKDKTLRCTHLTHWLAFSPVSRTPPRTGSWRSATIVARSGGSVRPTCQPRRPPR